MFDIEIIDQGSVVGFAGRTPEGEAFLTDKVESEGWQWLGNVLYVDHRCVEGLIEAIALEGLAVC